MTYYTGAPRVLKIKRKVKVQKRSGEESTEDGE